MKHQLCSIFVVFLGFLSSPCWAILDLHVQELLVVKEKPSGKAATISELAKGDVVVVSPDFYSGFRKVLVMFHGKRVPGYVESRSIKQSYIRDRQEEQYAEEVPIVPRSYTFGIFAAGFFMHQGGRALTDAQGNLYDVSAMQSFMPFFALYADLPFSQAWVVRPYISFRSIKLRGTANYRNGVSPVGTTSAEIAESFIGPGALLKYYPSAETGFWFGGALEYAIGTSMNASISNNGFSLGIPSLAKANLIIGQFATGLDVDLGQFQLNPEFRLGAIASSPVAIAADIIIGFGLRL